MKEETILETFKLAEQIKNSRIESELEFKKYAQDKLKEWRAKGRDVKPILIEL